MRSLRYFLSASAPAFFIVFRIHFRGLPSTVSRTSLGSRPISEGISGKSLLVRSSVLIFLHKRILLSNYLSRLLLIKRVVRLGIFLKLEKLSIRL